jgi:hypothetical protein
MTDSARATSKIALVLADFDGTLLTSDKVLTSQAAMAVKDPRTAGIAFAITSGRPPRGMAMLINPLALRTPSRRLQRRRLCQARPLCHREPHPRSGCGNADPEVDHRPRAGCVGIYRAGVADL